MAFAVDVSALPFDFGPLGIFERRRKGIWIAPVPTRDLGFQQRPIQRPEFSHVWRIAWIQMQTSGNAFTGYAAAQEARGR
jgi:hypothetical protein